MSIVKPNQLLQSDSIVQSIPRAPLPYVIENVISIVVVNFPPQRDVSWPRGFCERGVILTLNGKIV